MEDEREEASRRAPRCWLSRGWVVLPFNGAGYDGREASFGGKTESPPGYEMPGRHSNGHRKLTAGQLGLEISGRY